MPSTFTENTGIELIADGEQSGLWGQTTNDNFEIVDRALNGSVNISLSGTTHTLTTASGVLSDGQFAVLVFTGSPSGTNTVTIEPNTAQKTYFVTNSTAQTVVLSQGTGANVSVPAGLSKIVFTNGAGAGAAVFDITNTLSGTFTGNASTATALQTARTIGGVSFNGTANINLPGVNIGGNQNTTGSAASLTTARTIGGVSFNGTANINLPGVNIGGNQNTTGSAASLTTARTFTIGATGKTFNGTANVAWSLAEIGVGTLGQQAANNVNIAGGTIDGTVIGGSTPAAISGTDGSFSDRVTINTNNTGPLVITNSTSNNFTPNITMSHSRGTVENPTETLAGDRLLGILARGFDGTDYTSFSAGIQLHATESGSGGGTHIRFETAPLGSSSRTERMRIDASGNVGVGTSNPSSALTVQGTITGTAVTQSPTDTTAGRLMKVGDFKIGEEGSTDVVQPLGSVARHNMTTSLIYKGRLTSGDLDEIYEPGIYRINSAGDASNIANTPAQSSGAVLEVISPDSIRSQGSRALVTQRYTQRSQGSRVRVWQRSSRSTIADDWDDWQETYTQANILGTVSQSAGVPTGGIIQRGSNSNGEFVRFADGTQICTARVLATSVANTRVNTTFSWPASFVANPSVSAQTDSVVFGPEDNLRVWYCSNKTTTAFTITTFRTNNTNSGGDVIGFGSWF